MKMKYEFTQEVAKKFALDSARHVEVRHYVDGNSIDEWRDASQSESDVIYACIYGALLQARRSDGVSSDEYYGILNTAEYIASVSLGDYIKCGIKHHVNCYDSVYCPIANFLREHEIKVSAA